MTANRRVKFLLSMVLVFSTACGSKSETADTETPASAPAAASEPAAVPTTEAEPEKEFYDEDFLKDFAASIQGRWEAEDARMAAGEVEEESADPDQEVSEAEVEQADKEYVSFNKDVIKAETDLLSVYRDRKFKDSKLAEYANAYLDLLNTQNEALDIYFENTDEFITRFFDADTARGEVIADLSENYGLAIDEKHMPKLNKIMNSRYTAQYGESDFYDMLADWEYLAKDNGEEVLIVTNMTPYTFKDIDLYPAFVIEKDGMSQVTELGDETHFEEWKPEEKAEVKLNKEQVGKLIEEYGDFWVDIYYY